MDNIFNNESKNNRSVSFIKRFFNKTPKNIFRLFFVFTLIILGSLMFSKQASAMTYYVDSSITDTNVASSTPDCTNYNPTAFTCSGGSASAFKTIADVNLKSFLPGDSILFKKGDIFYGSLTVSQSGTASSPITFSSYGTGDKPIITGFTKVTSWTNKGGNIWESTDPVSTLPTVNMVTVNDVNTAMGRWPNVGWNTMTGVSGATQITDSQLTDTPNWTGAEVVIRKNSWIIDRHPITNQSGGTLIFTSTSPYNPKVGWGYFIQNDLKTLDQQNEWYYNPSTKKIRIYSTVTPTNVQVSTQDTLVFMTYKNYITFDNIQFTGANASAIYAGSSANLTIQNCNFDFNYNGINTQNWGNSSANYLLNNNTINHSNNNAVYLTDEFTNATVTNNIIQNSGILVGMSGSGDGKAQGLNVMGTGSLVQYNQIINTGYNGIVFNGSNVQIKNNLINYACMVKDDGAGIYTYNDTGTGKTISFNTVLNSIGNSEGTPHTSDAESSSAFGIYLDNNSSNVSVLNNTIANSGKGGIYLHDVKNIIMRNNTVYNSGVTGLLIIEDEDSSFYTTNLIIENNIFFVKNAPVVQNSYGNMTTDFNQLAFKPITIHNNIASWGTINSNYYARPMDDNLVFNVQPTGETSTPGLYLMKTLAAWQSYSGFDANSHKSPITLSDPSDILFDYTIDSIKTVNLSTPMIDVTGTKYPSSITLQPYTSVVLMPDTTLPTAPTISISTPSTGAISGSVSVTATAGVTSPATISSVQFYLDGVALQSPVTVSPYTITWGTTTTTNASHTLTAVATDSYNNTTTSTGVVVKVDNLGPTGTISNGSGSGNNVTPTLNLTIADVGVGITGAQMQFSCDGTNWSVWKSYATPKTNFNVRISEGCTDVDGSKTVYVRYKDSLGNVGSPYNTGAFTLDTSASFATLSGTPASTTNSTSASITVTGTNIVSYKYKLDSGSYGTETLITTLISLSSLADGSHLLSVIGKNSLGTWQDQGVATTYTWTVDITAPAVTFSIPSTSNSLTITFTSFSATDANTITGYLVNETATTPAIDNTGWAGTAQTKYVFTTNGTKTLYAWAKDRVGNISTSGRGAVTITLPTQVSSQISNSSGGSSPLAMDQFKATQQGLTPTTAPTITPTPSVSLTLIVLSRIVKLSNTRMWGDDVLALQTLLNTKGYDVGTPDGSFGPKTQAAVIIFQKTNGLVPDGSVGPNTLKYLNGNQTTTTTTTPSIQPTVTRTLKLSVPRMIGDDIKTLQTYLNTKGYDAGTLDGVLGTKTKSAIIAFQTANGLTPDGIMGAKTREIMK